MNNPFAALFEDVDQASDPMLAEGDLTDVMFAPLAPPAAPPSGSSGSAAPRANALHEMLSPPPRASEPAPRRAIQQALVITWDKGKVPDLLELNDLLASGWRVATTAGFPTADGSRGSLLVVVEQESPR